MREPLASRNLAKYGMRRGAYDGANRRRFVLFVADSEHRTEWCHEFNTKRERDNYAMRKLAELAS
jgi:hypothetical protein